MLSVIVLTHNNFSKKGGSIELTINALLDQTNVEYEIVIVSNSSSQEDEVKLESLIANKASGVISLISVDLSIGEARNYGANRAIGQVILFVDDDTVVLGNDFLHRIYSLGIKYDYGYGATRPWGNFFNSNEHKENINALNLGSQPELLRTLSCSQPNPDMRNMKTNKHLVRTYIGNLGFVTKNLFVTSGGFDPRFKGYGGEDDAFMAKLYSISRKYINLSNMIVIHIDHEIDNKCYHDRSRNREIYKQYLKEIKVEDFDVLDLLYS